MTKLIWILAIVLVLFAGSALYKYWLHIENQRVTQRQETAAREIVPSQLPGLPENLVASLDQAQHAGAPALGYWLKTYGDRVQDPRKAWIELDYCILIARNNPREARRIFADVKKRTPPSSPVRPRIESLSKTYE